MQFGFRIVMLFFAEGINGIFTGSQSIALFKNHSSANTFRLCLGQGRRNGLRGVWGLRVQKRYKYSGASQWVWLTGFASPPQFLDQASFMSNKARLKPPILSVSEEPITGDTKS